MICNRSLSGGAAFGVRKHGFRGSTASALHIPFQTAFHNCGPESSAREISSASAAITTGC
jgi:hypothetical protein